MLIKKKNCLNFMCNNILFYRSHDQIQKQIVTAAQLDKPPPKKRGRKRRIEELQESNWYDKYNLQYCSAAFPK